MLAEKPVVWTSWALTALAAENGAQNVQVSHSNPYLGNGKGKS